jgi:hypothetical protein
MYIWHVHHKVAVVTYIMFCFVQCIDLYLFVTFFSLRGYTYVIRHNCTKLNLCCIFVVSKAFCARYFDVCGVLYLLRHCYYPYFLVYGIVAFLFTPVSPFLCTSLFACNFHLTL